MTAPTICFFDLAINNRLRQSQSQNTKNLPPFPLLLRLPNMSLRSNNLPSLPLALSPPCSLCLDDWAPSGRKPGIQRQGLILPAVNPEDDCFIKGIELKLQSGLIRLQHLPSAATVCPSGYLSQLISHGNILASQQQRYQAAFLAHTQLLNRLELDMIRRRAPIDPLHFFTPMIQDFHQTGFLNQCVDSISQWQQQCRCQVMHGSEFNSHFWTKLLRTATMQKMIGLLNLMNSKFYVEMFFSIDRKRMASAIKRFPNLEHTPKQSLAFTLVIYVDQPISRSQIKHVAQMKDHIRGLNFKHSLVVKFASRSLDQPQARDLDIFMYVLSLNDLFASIDPKYLLIVDPACLLHWPVGDAVIPRKMDIPSDFVAQPIRVLLMLNECSQEAFKDALSNRAQLTCWPLVIDKLYVDASSLSQGSTAYMQAINSLLRQQDLI